MRLLSGQGVVPRTSCGITNHCFACTSSRAGSTHRLACHAVQVPAVGRMIISYKHDQLPKFAMPHCAGQQMTAVNRLICNGWSDRLFAATIRSCPTCMFILPLPL
jgi:hypothetical protein